jgi:hypothetical protein
LQRVLILTEVLDVPRQRMKSAHPA